MDRGGDIIDVAVVGAGAAGIVAAFRAAERGRRTMLIEKNARPGVKILMSGGTRCNLTQATDNRGIVRAFGPSGKFLFSALAALGVDETIAMFEAEGVATKVEETGKVFPLSDKASHVLAALMARLERSGATVSFDEPLLRLETHAGGFRLQTSRRSIEAEHVIVTTGGQSFPGSGTTGDGYRFAAELGHTIVPPRPALVPLTTDVAWARELSGVTLGDVEIAILDGSSVLARRRGSLLFAHFGLTGPAALDVSRVVSSCVQPNRLVAEIDLLPGRKLSDLSRELQQAAASAGRKSLIGVLAAWLPRRMAEIIVNRAGVPHDRQLAQISKNELQAVLAQVKSARVPLSGTMGFRKAEVTAGGVALGEVDSSTMESKLVPGLFFAGELLDLDGPIGGYNFQAAWSTGWLAGTRA